MTTERFCLVCGDPDAELDHIRTRAAGAKNEYWETQPLCRRHHAERHHVGIITFVKKHWRVWKYIHDMGWQIENGKLIRVKK